MKTLRHLLYFATGVLATALSANAHPYASGLTNNQNGTMSFILNESGGAVTITYDDGSIDSTYNGATFNSGVQTFNYGAHSNYTISVYKVGAGLPTLISNSFAFTPRGIAVNSRAASPYFGRLYADQSAGNIFVMNADLSLVYPSSRSAGQTWAGGGLSPYRCFVAEDDSLFVGDASSAHAGVYWVDPTVSTSQVFLGPVGEQNGLNAGVFGTIQSRPVIVGNPSTGLVTLMDVDGDLDPAGGNGYNSLLIYSNINPASLPYEQPPSVLGPEVGVNLNSEPLGDNEYPGLFKATNGYIYASTYRNNYSNPLIQIYDATGTNLIWDSYYNGGNSDYFLTTNEGITQGIIDSSVSADGLYIAGVTIDNWFVICPLTNGIPNTANIYLSTPTAFTGNARGLSFDAADNLYLSSSGLGEVQSWSLGLTTTAVTTGDTNGSTGFQLVLPANGVFVTVATNSASQGGSDGTTGTPAGGGFTITRTNANGDYSTPMLVNFVLGGTATNGTYTLLPAGLTVDGKNSITLPAGVTSTNITIVPTTNNVPRLETTVTLTISGGASYTVDLPSSGSLNVVNTSTNQLVVSVGAPSMYKAFSNDYAYATITRLGDTSVSLTIPASAFTYSGSAVANVDFVPVPAITFNPGDVTHLAQIFPLSNGVPPIDVTNPVYVGNKSVTVTLNPSAGVSYEVGAASTPLTLIDNATPPAPLDLMDSLTTTNDAANWNITFGSVDDTDDPKDYNVQFGYDLTANNPNSGNNGLIGLPPSGATTALRINACQNLQAAPEWEGGVNVYYTNALLAGNFAVRFYMNNVQGYPTPVNENTVGGPVFGINHDGRQTNWWEESGPTPPQTPPAFASDGVWYWVDCSPGATVSDYMEFEGDGSPVTNTGWLQLGGLTYSSFEGVFKDPAVFTTYEAFTTTPLSGDPANISPLENSIPPAADNDWADVEIDQVNGVVTMSIDKTPIFVYTNTSIFTNGYLMLGYCCPFTGAHGQAFNPPDQAVYFSDLRVAELGPNFTVEPPATIEVGAGTNVNIPVTTGYASSSVTNQLYNSSGAAVGSPVITSGSGGPATLTFTGTNANSGSYYVVSSDMSGSSTSSVVAVTIVNPPVITSEPVSVTNNIGATVTFTVGASGAGATLAYQWSSNSVILTNGGVVSGATTATLTLTSIKAVNDASYSVVVTNFAGSATSAPATLTAIVPPSPSITSVALSGTKVVMTFTVGDEYDMTNSFNLQASTNLTGPNDGFVDVTATFTTNNGSVTVSVPTNSSPDTFYRLQHK